MGLVEVYNWVFGRLVGLPDFGFLSGEAVEVLDVGGAFGVGDAFVGTVSLGYLFGDGCIDEVVARCHKVVAHVFAVDNGVVGYVEKVYFHCVD